MIIQNKIIINISYRNITHYLKLGYKAHLNKPLEINICDLSHGSHQKIAVKCEICDKENILQYFKYIENKNRHGYYGCKSCSRQKAVITNRLLYGVENITMLDSMKEQIANNNIKKYGVKTTLLEAKTIEKGQKTMLKKYNTDKFYEIRRPTENKKLKILNIISKENDIINPISNYGEIKIDILTKERYRNDVTTLTNRNIKKLFDNWDGYDYYDNEFIKNNFLMYYTDPKYPCVDHKTSVLYGFKNNIPPSEIAHIDNLCITKRSLNSSKRDLNENEFKEKLKII